MIVRLLIFCFSFCLTLYPLVSWGADIDFGSLRDPFLPQVPKREKIKTSIEEPHIKVDNAKANTTIAIVNQDRAVVQKISKPVVVLPPIEIQGIVWGGDGPMVLIDGQVYTLGNRFKGIEIKSIQKNGLDVQYKGKKFHVNVES